KRAADGVDLSSAARQTGAGSTGIWTEDLERHAAIPTNIWHFQPALSPRDSLRTPNFQGSHSDNVVGTVRER
ncbi:MAG: hypothetical protein ACE1ZA_07845, partial [Pseudomonadales bacterium]